MASRREKGKIAHTEWPAIAARYSDGESLASIARSYGCTAPAIRYIVNRRGHASKIHVAPRLAFMTQAEPSETLAGSAIDRALRDQVNSDIAAFLVAFDAAFLSNSAGNRHALRDATDRLLHAGARTRIAVERMVADDVTERAAPAEGRRPRQRAASGSARDS